MLLIFVIPAQAGIYIIIPYCKKRLNLIDSWLESRMTFFFNLKFFQIPLTKFFSSVIKKIDAKNYGKRYTDKNFTFVNFNR